ncbi:MAG: hypothetical protein AB7P04_06495 [Bacteriovoracia bacterium]
MKSNKRDVTQALAAAASIVLMAGALTNCNVTGTDESKLFRNRQLPARNGAKVTFADLKAHVLGPSCTSCHVHKWAEDSASEGDLHALAGRIVPGKPEASALFVRMNLDSGKEGAMPPVGKVAQGQIDLVRDYIVGLAPAPGPTDPPPAPKNADYVTLQAGLFGPACVRCHSPDGIDEYPPLHTYENARKHAKDALRRILDEEDPMPPRRKEPRPTAEMIELLKQWIDADFPEKTEKAEPPVEPVPPQPEPMPQPEPGPPVPPPSDPTPPSEPTPGPPSEPAPQPEPPKASVTYAQIKARVLEPACLKCHAAGAEKPKKPFLETYDAVKAEADLILELIEAGDMPPKKSEPKPSAEDIQLFKDWMAAGLPEK